MFNKKRKTDEAFEFEYKYEYRNFMYHGLRSDHLHFLLSVLIKKNIRIDIFQTLLVITI